MVRLARPVARTTIIDRHPRFFLAVERDAGILGMRLLNHLARQVDTHLRLGPIDIINPFRREDHVVPQPPIARIDDDVTDRPRFLIDYETLYVTDIAIVCMHVIAHDLVPTAQMDIVVLMSRVGARYFVLPSRL